MEVLDHLDPRMGERVIGVVRKAKLLAGLRDDGGNNGVAIMRDGREKVVHNLVVQTAREEVPEMRSGSPVSGTHGLLSGPVQGGVGNEVVLDVVHDEDVFEVMGGNSHQQERRQESKLPRSGVEVGEEDVEGEPEGLEEAKLDPVSAGNGEGLRSNTARNEVEDV